MADMTTRAVQAPTGPGVPPRKPNVPADRPNVLGHFLRGMRGAAARHWTFKVGAVLLAVILIILLLTPWIAPHDPAVQDLSHRLAGPTAGHWFGTDHLGRDVLSRLMWGGRFSVTIAAITLVICAVAGSVIGAPRSHPALSRIPY